MKAPLGVCQAKNRASGRSFPNSGASPNAIVPPDMANTVGDGFRLPREGIASCSVS